MATIIENLKKILEARYGKDVRQAIHDSIENCYNDGKAGSIDLQARQMLGDTNISSIADGTVTGSVKTLSDKATANEAAISEVNSNLEKLVIISQSIELENNISSFTLIKSGFSKPPKTMYVLLDALEPNKSGTYVKLYLNNQGDLYTTTESMLSGTWYINGAYISV